MAGAGLITSMVPIEPSKTRRGAEPRWSVGLDGQPWAELESETVVRHALKVGRRLSMDERNAVLRADAVLRARRWAAARCAARPRSRRMLEQELAGRHFGAGVIAEALDALEAAGTLSDAAVAARHLRKRARGGGYGPARLRHELLEMGIGRAVADAALAEGMGSDPPESACLGLARMRAARYQPLSNPKNRNRLAHFLQRRGFESEAISLALRRLSEGADSDES